MKHVLAILSVLLLGAACAGVDYVDESAVITGDTFSLSIDLNRLAMTVLPLQEDSVDGEEIILALPAGNFAVEIIEQKPDSIIWRLVEKDILFSVVCKKDYLEVVIEADRKNELKWPVIGLDKGDTLIWPWQDGRYIPADHKGWKNYLQGSWNMTNDLMIPFWSVEAENQSTTWISETPNHVDLSFTDPGEGLDIAVLNRFLCREGKEKHIFRIYPNRDKNPVSGAFLFRDYLIEKGLFVSFEEKKQYSDDLGKLLGAPQIYLWGKKQISMEDIYPDKWSSLAGAIKWEAQQPGMNVGKEIQAHMDKGCWAALEEVAALEYPYDFIKGEMVRGLSDYLTGGGDKNTLFEAYPGCFKPEETWGEGISRQMVREIKEAGIDRARFCVPGMEEMRYHKGLAEFAGDLGYLFGVYDGYESIHPESIAGTDGSWETAQFDDELYNSGGIQREDGSFYSGFKGIGRTLNPVAARSWFESRINNNLSRFDFNYYFIDCDAAGEVYEDYNPLHPSTMEEIIKERLDRLSWLQKGKGLILGSEGGMYSLTPALHVAEGIFAPVFYWEDKDFTDKESPYYLGRWWPDWEPENMCKEVPLKELFIERYYNPAYRLPLYEIVFHDSVMPTHHWESGTFKFKNVRKTIQLMQMLYLVPPLYNLNRPLFAERKDIILSHYKVFADLHGRFGFSRMTGFAYLTEDRLVQETEFEGGLKIVVNFSDYLYRCKDQEISSGSSAAFDQTGKIISLFTPFEG